MAGIPTQVSQEQLQQAVIAQASRAFQTVLAIAEQHPEILEERPVEGKVEKWVKCGEVTVKALEDEKTKLEALLVITVPSEQALELAEQIRKTKFDEGYSVESTIRARLSLLEKQLAKMKPPA